VSPARLAKRRSSRSVRLSSPPFGSTGQKFEQKSQPATGPAQDVLGDERRVIAEDDLLRLAVELDRLDAARQLAGRPWVGNLPPDGVRGTHTEAP
jgi:hypothetical protein